MTRRHLPVLDGLRGVAAIAVVFFHFQEMSVAVVDANNIWLRHAYLAVDLFFCLSGYVIGYAYDERHDMSVLQFIKVRLIRLHPMVILGVVLGLASYTLDPFSGTGHPAAWLELQQAPVAKIIACFLGGITMFPTASLPNRGNAIFALNAPAWSLLWEYVASLYYALVLWRARVTQLAAFVVVAAVGLAILAYHANTIALGFGWGQATYGLLRVAFSFSMGLLLFRLGGQPLKARLGFVFLSSLVLLVFLCPVSGNPETGAEPLTWAYDLWIVLVVFPGVVMIGANASAEGLVGRICAFSGRISYPIYAIHYAFVTIFVNYVWTRSVDAHAMPWLITLSTLAIIGISYVIVRFYDEPVRRFLGRKPRPLAVAPG